MSLDGFKLTATAALMPSYLGSLGTPATNGKNPSHCSTAQGAKASTAYLKTCIVIKVYFKSLLTFS
jgi:hypothetical protein